MYHKCPFKIVYDSLELEPKISRLVLKYLTNNNTVLNLMVILILKMSGVLVNFFKYGFDFTIHPRNPGDTVYFKASSNKYYFYFTDPASLTASTDQNCRWNRSKKMQSS